MRFNQEKSRIMFHNKIKRFDEGSTYKGMIVTRQIKFLGYMIDSRLNNLEHIKYIEKKIQKAKKMDLIAGK